MRPATQAWAVPKVRCVLKSFASDRVSTLVRLITSELTEALHSDLIDVTTHFCLALHYAESASMRRPSFVAELIICGQFGLRVYL